MKLHQHKDRVPGWLWPLGLAIMLAVGCAVRASVQGNVPDQQQVRALSMVPDGVALESMQREGDTLTLQGSCSSAPAVARFGSALLKDGHFGDHLIYLACTNGRFKIEMNHASTAG